MLIFYFILFFFGGGGIGGKEEEGYKTNACFGCFPSVSSAFLFFLCVVFFFGSSVFVGTSTYSYLEGFVVCFLCVRFVL